VGVERMRFSMCGKPSDLRAADGEELPLGESLVEQVHEGILGDAVVEAVVVEEGGDGASEAMLFTFGFTLSMQSGHGSGKLLVVIGAYIKNME